MATRLEAPKEPDAIYVRQRFIPPHVVEWVRECDRIMTTYGHVEGQNAYTTRDRARYPPRKLRALMLELKMHEGWQLKEHVGKTPRGWVWSLEYIPREIT